MPEYNESLTIFDVEIKTFHHIISHIHERMCTVLSPCCAECSETNNEVKKLPSWAEFLDLQILLSTNVVYLCTMFK